MAAVTAQNVLLAHRKMPARQPVNPADRCTVFSIYPKEVDEIKPTIQPGRFIIKPGTVENPSILVVGPSSWWREIDVDQPYLEIPNSSMQVAESIVKDYCNGMVGCNMEDSMPGLFYIPGTVTHAQLVKDYKSTFDKAIARQNKYWHTIIELTDILWSNTNGNPLCVSGDARLACQQLGVENKEWMQNFQNMGMIRCVACGALRNPAYPVCGTCNRVVDPVLASKLGIVPPAENHGNLLPDKK